MSGDSNNYFASRRKALKVAVSALCSEVGFGSADDAVLETLTEALQSFLTEVGRSSRSYSELSGRTGVMLSDVAIALIDMGINIDGIAAHAKRINKSVFLPPGHASASGNPKTLQVGEKKSHPSHIPDHLPAFPDAHTYIRTLTHKQPVNEYQIIREKAASQKRDVERALTRFIAKTGETQSLFKDDVSLYPLIAVRPTARPHLSALLPKDQEIDTLQASDIQEITQRHLQNQDSPVTSLPPAGAPEGDTGTDPNDTDIDNPYLRPVKMPKVRKKSIR